MATGVYNCGVDAFKDAYGLWFKPGDSISVSSSKGSYTGFLSNASNARCVIPLTKPVKPGTTVKLTGHFRIRTQTQATTITISNALTCTVTDCGLAVDINDGTTLGTANEPCSVGVMTNGMTITFS